MPPRTPELIFSDIDVHNAGQAGVLVHQQGIGRQAELIRRIQEGQCRSIRNTAADNPDRNLIGTRIRFRFHGGEQQYRIGDLQIILLGDGIVVDKGEFVAAIKYKGSLDPGRQRRQRRRIP